MRSEDSSQLRAKAEERRRRPQLISEVRVPINGIGEVDETKTIGPVYLNIEATDQHGDVAPWFDDFWWTELLHRWTDRMVTVQIEATPHAILHPVITYHMEMLDRVAPRWRTVAFTYTGDFADSESVEAIARSPFHEVRFMDGPRPETNSLGKRITSEVRVEVLFGAIRRIQSHIGAARPILTRLPSSVTTIMTTVTKASQDSDSQSHKDINAASPSTT